MGLSSIYKSMADETRLRILAILSRGSFNVGELTEILGAGQPNVSHHLKTLQSVGLVESHREGKWAFYKLSTKDPQRDVPTHVLQGFLTGLDLQNLPTSFDADRERMLQILQGRSARTRQYFDTVASSWQEIRDELHDDQLYVDRVSELIASADSLVELGCGAGHFLKHFLPRTGTTIAVDNSPEMLDRLRDTLGDLYEMVDPR